MIPSRTNLLSLIATIALFSLTTCTVGFPGPESPTDTPSTSLPTVATSTPTELPIPTRLQLLPTVPPLAQPAMPVRVFGISFADPYHGWMLGNTGTDPSFAAALAFTIDGGATWQPLPLPQSNFNPILDYAATRLTHGGIFFATAKDGWLFFRDLYSTRDGGLTWKLEAADGQIVEMGKTADGTVWALEIHGDDWVVKQVTVAPFREWQELISNFMISMDGASLTLADAQHAWVSFRPAGQKRELLTTDNSGENWHSLRSPCEVFGDGWVVAVGSRALWYACGKGGAGPWGDKLITRSLDGGQTWAVMGKATMIHQPTDSMSSYGYPTGMGAVSPTFVYLTLGRSSELTITRDGGTTWEHPKLGCSAEFYKALFIDELHGWAFDQTCINRTVDGGKTWTCIDLPKKAPCGS